MRPLPLAALALLALAAVAAAHGNVPVVVTLSPDPVPGDAPFTVRLAAGEPAASGVLRLCYSEGGNVTMCRLPQEMRPDGEGALVADPEPVPPAQEFGLNFTVRLADGTVLHHPAGDAQYEFHAAGAGARTTPGAGAAGASVAVLVAVLAFGRRVQRG